MRNGMSTGNASPSARSASSDTAAYLILAVSILFMSSNVVIGRAAVGSVPPVGLAFWRWTVAFLILLPFASSGLLRHRRILLAQWPRLLALGALGMGICGAVVYVGLQQTTATNAGLIYASSPVLIVLIGATLSGERIGLRQLAGIVLALSGVATILTRGNPASLLGLTFSGGDLLILAATVSWAAYSVLLRRIGAVVPTIPLFAAIALAGILVLLPFYLWETLAGRVVDLTFDTAASIGGLALISSVLAFSTYQKGVAIVGPSRAGPFMYMMPVWGAVLAVTFLGESFEPYHAVGFALVLPGVAFATLARSARRPAAD